MTSIVIQAAPMTVKQELRDRRVNLRLPHRLVNKVKASAKLERRSLNSMFEVIVSAWAAKQ
jgi:predicted DNA binding CopG/RHH family protein